MLRFINLVIDIGAWCNGSIHALGACSSGSNPGAPTNKTAISCFLFGDAKKG